MRAFLVFPRNIRNHPHIHFSSRQRLVIVSEYLQPFYLILHALARERAERGVESKLRLDEIAVHALAETLEKLSRSYIARTKRFDDERQSRLLTLFKQRIIFAPAGHKVEIVS